MSSCPGCKEETSGTCKNDSWPHKGRWSDCGRCGYPLEKSMMLERIHAQFDRITEFLTISHFAPPKDVTQIETTDAVSILREYEEILFPEYDGDDAIIFSIENDSLIINFTTHEKLLACFVPS